MANEQLFQLHFRSEKTINALIADILENLDPAPVSVSFFEDENKVWQTTAHYQVMPDTEVLKSAINDILGISEDQYQLISSKTEDIDWVSHVQKLLKPVRAGRFFIHGSHDNDKASNEPFAFEIDAAQAFGTAHHGTTKGCLIAIDDLSQIITPKNILDLGAGSGILAIAASKVWPTAEITASDIDPIAVNIASENETLNQNSVNPSRPITHLCIDGVNDPAINSKAPFDLIIANILAGPLIKMAGEVSAILNTNGQLLLSGILDTQSDEVVRAYVATGLKHQQTRFYGEWTTSNFIKQP